MTAEKTLLEKKVEENIGEVKIIYATAEKEIKAYIIAIMKDSKELLEYYTDLKILANEIVDIIDAKTNTGIWDVLDGVALKSILGFVITKESEIWWDKTRLELITAIDNEGAQNE